MFMTSDPLDADLQDWLAGQFREMHKQEIRRRRACAHQRILEPKRFVGGESA